MNTTKESKATGRHQTARSHGTSKRSAKTQRPKHASKSASVGRTVHTSEKRHVHDQHFESVEAPSDRSVSETFGSLGDRLRTYARTFLMRALCFSALGVAVVWV
jgi:hypothetical protein